MTKENPEFSSWPSLYCLIPSAVLKVADAPVADFMGYHSFNLKVWSRHIQVGDSTRRGCGVNVMWCWATSVEYSW